MKYNYRITTINELSQDQERRLIMEAEQMKRNFPRVISSSIHQNYNEVYYMINPIVNGIRHDIRLVYSYDHPESAIDAYVDWPTLDGRYMSSHWYGSNHICYIHNWNRRWTMLKVAIQVLGWLKDYYKEKNGRKLSWREFVETF